MNVFLPVFVEPSSENHDNYEINHNIDTVDSLHDMSAIKPKAVGFYTKETVVNSQKKLGVLLVCSSDMAKSIFLIHLGKRI